MSTGRPLPLRSHNGRGSDGWAGTTIRCSAEGGSYHLGGPSKTSTRACTRWRTRTGRTSSGCFTHNRRFRR